MEIRHVSMGAHLPPFAPEHESSRMDLDTDSFGAPFDESLYSGSLSSNTLSSESPTSPRSPRTDPATGIPIRPAVLHLSGIQPLLPADLYRFIGYPTPLRMEWLGHDECNVVYDSEDTAYKAWSLLCAHSEPLTNDRLLRRAKCGSTFVEVRFATTADVVGLKRKEPPQHLMEVMTDARAPKRPRFSSSPIPSSSSAPTPSCFPPSAASSNYFHSPSSSSPFTPSTPVPVAHSSPFSNTSPFATSSPSHIPHSGGFPHSQNHSVFSDSHPGSVPTSLYTPSFSSFSNSTPFSDLRISTNSASCPAPPASSPTRGANFGPRPHEAFPNFASPRMEISATFSGDSACTDDEYDDFADTDAASMSPVFSRSNPHFRQNTSPMKFGPSTSYLSRRYGGTHSGDDWDTDESCRAVGRAAPPSTPSTGVPPPPSFFLTSLSALHDHNSDEAMDSS